MNTKNFEQFTNLYKVQKTLRFELKPIGETVINIKKVDLLKADETRADNYKKAKKIIDEFHKDFIQQRLSRLSFEEADLGNYSFTIHKN